MKQTLKPLDGGRFSNMLFSAAMAICLAVFVMILGGCVFHNSYGLTPALLGLIMAAALTGLYFANRCFCRYETWLQKHYRKVVCVGLGVLLIANIVFGLLLRFEPIFDLGAIFTGAEEWSKTGNFMEHMNWTCDDNYFYYFPNNLGGMTLLYAAFEIASLFGITDYYAVAMVTNALLVVLSVLLTVLICKKTLGVSASITALLCFLIFPPFYFMAPVFYTDSLSMVFGVLMVFLYLKCLETESKKKKILLAAALGLACAAGMLIKFTVLIVLIAIVIYHAVCRKFLHALVLGAIGAGCIFAVFAGFNTYMYANHLDKATAEHLNTPYSHWVMMSLQGDGRYNSEDYEFTRSFDDPQQRNAAIGEKIKERIADRGVIGMLKLFYEKGIADFGDGTLAQSDFLDDHPRNDIALHDFVLYDGEHFEAYRYLCSGIYFSFLFLSCISAWHALKAKRNRESMIPLLCMCGIMMFLFMWEVSGRYATNFVPLMVVGAVYGIASRPVVKREKTMEV